jgi:hypothetical protein
LAAPPSNLSNLPEVTDAIETLWAYGVHDVELDELAFGRPQLVAE